MPLIFNFAVKNPKEKKCNKGYPCGASCISKNWKCRKPLEGQARAFGDWLKLQGSKSVNPNSGNNKPTISYDKIRSDSQKTKNKPTLKGKKFNPHAIEDLSFEEFQSKYLAYKKAVFEQETRLERAQMELDRGLKKGKSWAKLEITSAIEQGLYVPPDVIGSVKLKKSLREKNEKNSQPDPQIEKLRQQAEPIIKAVDYPLMTKTEGKGHKPTLSREEADAYTKNSYAAGLSFYHGNPTPVTRSIATDGAKPELNDDGYFGKGTYFGAARATAEGYMTRGITLDGNGKYTHVKHSQGADGVQKKQKDDDPEMGIIEIKSKIKNPLVADSNTLDSIPGGGQYLHDFARAKGYDSIYVQDLGYFVAFDTRQVAVVDTQEYKVGDENTRKIIDRNIDIKENHKKASRLLDKQGFQIRGKTAFEKRVNRISATGKTMNTIKKSKFP